jgi:uncharacterized membrane protein (DUF485 family)
MTPEELQKKNKRLGWILAVIVLALFFGFIIKTGLK